MYSTRLLRPCLWTATMVLYWRGAAEHGRPHTFFCTPPRPRTHHKRCAHTKRMSPALQTLQLTPPPCTRHTPAHCVSSPLHILFHCRHAGTQARRHAGTQAHRHAVAQSRSHARKNSTRTHARTRKRMDARTPAPRTHESRRSTNEFQHEHSSSARTELRGRNRQQASSGAPPPTLCGGGQGRSKLHSLTHHDILNVASAIPSPDCSNLRRTASMELYWPGAAEYGAHTRFSAHGHAHARATNAVRTGNE